MLFDTAEVYGFGRSERILAEALGADRGEVVVGQQDLPGEQCTAAAAGCSVGVGGERTAAGRVTAGAVSWTASRCPPRQASASGRSASTASARRCCCGCSLAWTSPTPRSIQRPPGPPGAGTAARPDRHRAAGGWTTRCASPMTGSSRDIAAGRVRARVIGASSEIHGESLHSDRLP